MCYLIKVVISESATYCLKPEKSSDSQTQSCNHPTDAAGSHTVRGIYAQHCKWATHSIPEKSDHASPLVTARGLELPLPKTEAAEGCASKFARPGWMEPWAIWSSGRWPWQVGLEWGDFWDSVQPKPFYESRSLCETNLHSWAPLPWCLKCLNLSGQYIVLKPWAPRPVNPNFL